MQTPKRMRRELRHLATKAEEAELRIALQPLASDFKRWESGQIDSFDLKALIHDFHQGAGRRIYLRYDLADPAPMVANAIARGILDSATISPDIITELAPTIALMRTQWADNDDGVAAETESSSQA